MAERRWEGNRTGITQADLGLVFYDGHECQKGLRGDGGVDLCELILWPAVEASGATIANKLAVFLSFPRMPGDRSLPNAGCWARVPKDPSGSANPSPLPLGILFSDWLCCLLLKIHS